MNIIEKHLAYLKDNPEGYWFKRKLYGWGWTPARPQGWITLLIYATIIIVIAVRAEKYAQGVQDILGNILIPFMVATILLISVCVWKGEKPRWQWGLKDIEKSNE